MPDPQYASLDRSFSSTAIKILPGECHVTRHDCMIATVLGSCVAVCMYDRIRKVGGMNHFMLPGNEEIKLRGQSARYGFHAMDRLHRDLLLHGADPANLEAKVVGAGRVIHGMTDIGRQNADFALKYLREKKIRIVAVELGDIHPRKVLFAPATGQVFIRQIREKAGDPIFYFDSMDSEGG